MRKGRMFFNIIIIITIIALIGVGGYAAYYYINRYTAVKEAEEAVDEFEERVLVVALEDEKQEEEQQKEEPEQLAEPTTTTRRTTSTTTYRGYSMIGTIQIPKTRVKAPIVDKVTVNSISAAVATLYGPGLNQVGNTVLVAHNYRNGTFFSNNKNLVVGDKIYITDQTGQKVEYYVTKTYITGEEDFDYAVRDTGGKREISLSTCTTDPTKRLVIWARES